MNFIDIIWDFENNRQDWYKIGDGCYRDVYGNDNFPEIVLKVNRQGPQNYNEVMLHLGAPRFPEIDEFIQETYAEFVRRGGREYLNPVLDWSEDFKYVIARKAEEPESFNVYSDSEIFVELSLNIGHGLLMDFDIHNQNVMIGDNGQPVIIDYGYIGIDSNEWREMGMEG